MSEGPLSSIDEGITCQRLCKNPTCGFVIHSGKTAENHIQIVETSLKLDNNPEFIAIVLVAYARAAHGLYNEGEKRC